MPGKADVMAELLYMKLEEHLRAIETIEKLVKSMSPADLGGSEQLEELRDAVARLRSLRKAMIADAERIISSIRGGEISVGAESEPLYALAGYYAEAAYHTEMRLLKKLGVYSTDSDMEDVVRLRSLFQEILRSLE